MARDSGAFGSSSQPAAGFQRLRRAGLGTRSRRRASPEYRPNEQGSSPKRQNPPQDCSSQKQVGAYTRCARRSDLILKLYFMVDTYTHWRLGTLLEIASSAHPGAMLDLGVFSALSDAKRDISERSERWRTHTGAARAAARLKKQPPGSQGAHIGRRRRTAAAVAKAPSGETEPSDAAIAPQNA